MLRSKDIEDEVCGSCYYGWHLYTLSNGGLPRAQFHQLTFGFGDLGMTRVRK